MISYVYFIIRHEDLQADIQDEKEIYIKLYCFCFHRNIDLHYLAFLTKSINNISNISTYTVFISTNLDGIFSQQRASNMPAQRVRTRGFRQVSQPQVGEMIARCILHFARLCHPHFDAVQEKRDVVISSDPLTRKTRKQGLNSQILLQQIHQDDGTPVPELLAQEVQLLPREEPLGQQIRQLGPIPLVARGRLRNVGFEFRLDERLHLAADARTAGEFALEHVVHAEHEVEPPDAVLACLAVGFVDAGDEVLEGVFATALAARVLLVLDELHGIQIVEEDGGVARGIAAQMGGHEIGERELLDA